VAFIDPMVDSQTRTVGVRVEIDNAQGRLRPGDYATAAIKVPLLGEGDAAPLVVPRSAVLMAGENSVVYVETDPGRFEIRPVALGPLTDRFAVIVEGVEEGEQDATSGNFLIDSQMQLAGKPSLIDPAKAKLELMKPKGPLKVKELATRQFAGPTGEALERMYQAYFVIAAALSEDRAATAEQAAALRAAAEETLAAKDLPDELKKLVEPVAKRAEDLRDENVDEARVALLKISPNVIRLAAQARGAGAESAFIQFHCFMHGDWLQAGEPLANPYCGRKSKMIRCGKKVRELPAQAEENERT
jgi:Cu(I)/Ag(I) efflux system membrane fusion protein